MPPQSSPLRRLIITHTVTTLGVVLLVAGVWAAGWVSPIAAALLLAAALLTTAVAFLSLRTALTRAGNAELPEDASLAQYQEVFNASSDAIFLHDAETGRVLDVNEQALAMYGISRDELDTVTPERFSEATGPFTGEHALALLRKAVTEGPQTFEWHARRSSGELFWVEVALRQSMIAGRNCVVASVRDISVRREALEALRQSEIRLREAQTLAGIGHWEWDLASGAVTWSDEVYRIFKQNPDEFQPSIDSVMALSPWPETREIHLKLIEGLTETHTPGTFEQRFLFPDGSEGYYYSTCAGIFDEDGELVTVRGTVQDITKRKRDAQAIHDREHQLQVLFDQTADPIYVSDLHGRLTRVNGAACKATGYSEEELLGLTVMDVDPGMQDTENLEAFFKTFEPGATRRIESIHRRKDGTTFPVEITIARIPTPEGERMLGIARDIAERKEAEQALRESEERFRSLVEAAPIAILLLRDGKYTFANPAAAAMLGYDDPDKLVGVDALSTVAPEFQDTVRGRMRRIAEAHDNLPIEIQFVRPDGTRVWSHSQSIAIRINGARGAVVAGLDITRQREAAERLRHSEALLAQSQAMAHVGSWELDVQADTLTWSDEVYRIFGIKPEQFGGHMADFVDAIHPDDRAHVQEAFHSSIENPTARYEVEHRIIHAETGEVRTVLERCEHIRNSEGEAIRSRGMVRDITEQKRAEDALRASEVLYRTLVDGLPDIVVRFDTDGRHLFVSSNVEQLVGVPVEALLGKTAKEAGFPDALADEWTSAIRRVAETGTVLETTFKLNHEGGTRHFDWRLIPERDASGNVDCVISIARDVTEYLRVQRDYQILFREMLDGFALHEIICDDDGKPIDYRFLAVNPAFERLTGLKAESLVGRTVLEVMPATEARWIETYGRVALTGQPARLENHATELGKYFNVAAFQPAPGQFACIFEDVTARRMAERRQQLMVSELDHRVKNNLAAVQGLAEQTMRNAQSLDEFGHAFLGRIQAMARTHEALARAKWEGIDMAEAARLAVMPYLQAGRERVQLAGDSLRLPALAAPPLSLALHELATNAVKYGALSVPDGKVDLTWDEQEDGEVEIVWRESGGPQVTPPNQSGTGTSLIRGLVTYELQGQLDLTYPSDGVECRMTFQPKNSDRQVDPSLVKA